MNSVPLHSAATEMETFFHLLRHSRPIFTASVVVSILEFWGERSNMARIDQALLTNSPNDRTSICILAVYCPTLGSSQSENTNLSIFEPLKSMLMLPTHLVMHPAEPFNRNLRSIVIHMKVWCVFYPTIAPVEVVVVFIIFITVFVGAHKSANLQIVHSERENQIEIG